MAQGKILDIRSKWVGNSQVHVTIRKISVGWRKKFVIDLLEISPENVEVKREQLNKLAISSAEFFGTSSSDFCVIRDHHTSRKATRAKDGAIVGVNIRERSYVFADFPEGYAS